MIFFTNPTLVEVGKKHNKTAAQVALRFLVQNGVVIIPKSTHKKRMQENIDIWDFKLSSDEMDKIKQLDTNKSLFFDHRDPKIVDALTDLTV